MHFPLFSLRVMCLFMQTERKHVNSFENTRRKCENGTFDMALSCKCLQIPLWSLCGQRIPRTERGVGGRKETVKLFMNCILSFPAEVHQWPAGAVGRRVGWLPSAPAGSAGRRSPQRAGGGRAKGAPNLSPAPAISHLDEPYATVQEES